MASRTGHDGLLVLLAKVASAGSVLALATAVSLVFSGCGGNSDAKTPSTSAKAPAGAATEPTSPGGEVSSGSSKKDATASKPAGPGEDGEGSTAQRSKSGRRVAAPKGPKEPEPTPAQLAHATVASMSLESPVLNPEPGSVAVLPTTYTCDGEDSWPALHWAAAPKGTAELVLFAMNVQPVAEKLFFDWAVAGLHPSLTGIEAGVLPKEAVTGQNSFDKVGYSICPSGAGETYMFALYALPRQLSPGRGFDPSALRKEVLQVSGDVGLLPTVYLRG